MTQELETVIMTAVETHVEQAVALLTELVNIPSVVPLGSESAGDGERRVQEVLERELRALGAEVDLWEPDVAELAAAYRGKPGFQPNRQFENRPNLVARLPGDGTGRSIMLAGHIDVVAADSADWHSEPFDARIVDGRLVGRGTADMKAGVVASWLALKALKEAGVQLAGDVLFVSVVDEEVGGMGTLAVTHRGYRADAGVMTEPTGLTLCPVVRGIIWGHIDVPGRAGHIEEPFDAANPEAPIDAIDKARIVLGAIDKINASWRNDPRKSHPLIEIPNQVSVSMIHAGDHPSSFAATCRITVDIQYLTSEEDEHGLGGGVKRSVEAAILDACSSDPWLASHPPSFDWFVDADPGEIPSDHPIVATFASSLRAVGVNPRIVGKGAHTDMSLLTRYAHTPMLTFGPAEPEMAHQANESVAIHDLATAAKAIALATADWCGTR